MEIRNFNLYFHKPAHSGEAGERGSALYQWTRPLAPIGLADPPLEAGGVTTAINHYSFGDCLVYTRAATSREPLLFKGGNSPHIDIEPA